MISKAATGRSSSLACTAKLICDVLLDSTTAELRGSSFPSALVGLATCWKGDW